MILLDTNVVSETMSGNGSTIVLRWIDAQPERALFLSSISLAEIQFGLRLLPDGRRRAGLERACARLADDFFQERVLSFDARAAVEYGILRAGRQAIGRPLSVTDGLIAAIARAHSLALATRNVRDFDGLGLSLINPFDGAVP